MAKRTTDEGEPDDRLAEAQAQIESLQTAAADAEARAATARKELKEAREARSAAEAQLTEAAAAREAVEGELLLLRTEIEEARSRLGEAAVKYREAKLASAPEIPPDLVPSAQSLSEIDEGFEAAQRVVGQLRERIQEERRPARVPVGSPPRRAPDLFGAFGVGEDQAWLAGASRRAGGLDLRPVSCRACGSRSAYSHELVVPYGDGYGRVQTWP